MAIGLNSNEPIKYPHQTREGTGVITSSSSAGDTVIAAASGTSRVRLLRFVLSVDAACNIKFTDSGGDLSATFYLAANQVLSADEEAFIKSNVAGSALNMNTSSTANVSIHAFYEYF